jgi:L-amino acid N-acyltransferase YncA
VVTNVIDLTIRLATPDDLPAINDIYNHFVLTSTCTYQTDPETMEARRAWLDAHGHKHPVTVALDGNHIFGWGSLSPFHKRAAYSRSVENSVYVHRQHHRKGIGGKLLADLISRATALGHHTIIAGIDAEQTSSIALHQAHGFERVALLKEVGFKFDRWLHVIYMQRML